MQIVKKRWRWLLLLAPISLVTLWPAFRTHAQTSHSATLTWSYTQGPDAATGFFVQRATGACSPTSAFANVNTTAIPVATLTYQDTTISAGASYCYQVVAVDAAGNQSAPSNQVAAVILANPAPPTGLAVATN
jgi:chitodextrinase